MKRKSRHRWTGSISEIVSGEIAAELGFLHSKPPQVDTVAVDQATRKK